MKLTVLGAGRCVTGSKYLLEWKNYTAMVDCGLFQGPAENRRKNWKKLPYPAGDIDAVVRLGNSGEDTGTRDGDQMEMFQTGDLEIKTRKKTVEPRTKAQQDYVRALYGHELAFGIGPAGTGKTYLAVAVGVNMFLNGQVDKIILSRPAVEAGEKLIRAESLATLGRLAELSLRQAELSERGARLRSRFLRGA